MTKSQDISVKRYRQIKLKLRTLGEAKLWDLEICSGITEPLIKARDLIEQEIRKIQNRKAKSGAEMDKGQKAEASRQQSRTGEGEAKNGTN